MCNTTNLGIDIVHSFPKHINGLQLTPIADHRAVVTLALDERWQDVPSQLPGPMHLCSLYFEKHFEADGGVEGFEAGSV